MREVLVVQLKGNVTRKTHKVEVERSESKLGYDVRVDGHLINGVFGSAEKFREFGGVAIRAVALYEAWPHGEVEG